MSKKRKDYGGRGLIAIALFQIASALERQAAAEAKRNELLDEANNLHYRSVTTQEEANDALQRSLGDLARGSSTGKPHNKQGTRIPAGAVVPEDNICRPGNRCPDCLIYGLR